MSSKLARIKVDIETTFSIELDEQEIGALNAIFGYNADAFLKAFRREMGAAYVDPYENGVRSLHERIRGITSPVLSELREVRRKLSAALRE